MECVHPHDRQMYKQYTKAETAAVGITVADLFGGINPYDWRIEYCGACGKVFRTYGEVPASEFPHQTPD